MRKQGLVYEGMDDIFEEEEIRLSVSYFLKQRWICINLFVMTVVWLATSFDSYLLQFLVATFKSEFKSGIGLGIADIGAFTAAGFVYQKLGAKVSLIGAYTVATISGIVILSYGL